MFIEHATGPIFQIIRLEIELSPPSLRAQMLAPLENSWLNSILRDLYASRDSFQIIQMFKNENVDCMDLNKKYYGLNY